MDMHIGKWVLAGAAMGAQARDFRWYILNDRGCFDMEPELNATSPNDLIHRIENMGLEARIRENDSTEHLKHIEMPNLNINVILVQGTGACNLIQKTLWP